MRYRGGPSDKQMEVVGQRCYEEVGFHHEIGVLGNLVVSTYSPLSHLPKRSETCIFVDLFAHSWAVWSHTR